MKERIKKLCAYLDACTTFADVGCDHGYCTQYMLKKGLCQRAYVSDISPKCLEKAQKLLADYINTGVVIGVCCNGLELIDKEVDQVLIAGMGGEEIISILKNGFIPKKFLFQPMHNQDKLYNFLVENGAKIFVYEKFTCKNKYYVVIKGERGV